MRQQRERDAKLAQARAVYEQALAKKIEPLHPLLPRDMVGQVAQLFMMTPHELMAGRLKRHIDARATVIQILKRRNLSLMHIGRVMKRDHSTIASALDKMEIYKARNPMVGHVLEIIT
jgi:chromosomal replication initiation ATPase DnaA